MTMFGYDRRPELFKEPVFPEPMSGFKWLNYAASCGLKRTHQQALDMSYELGKTFKRGSGLKDMSNWLDVAHAAPKVAELWAFETGRLP